MKDRQMLAQGDVARHPRCTSMPRTWHDFKLWPYQPWGRRIVASIPLWTSLFLTSVLLVFIASVYACILASI